MTISYDIIDLLFLRSKRYSKNTISLTIQLYLQNSERILNGENLDKKDGILDEYIHLLQYSIDQYCKLETTDSIEDVYTIISNWLRISKIILGFYRAIDYSSHFYRKKQFQHPLLEKFMKEKHISLCEFIRNHLFITYFLKRESYVFICFTQSLIHKGSNLVHEHHSVHKKLFDLLLSVYRSVSYPIDTLVSILNDYAIYLLTSLREKVHTISFLDYLEKSRHYFNKIQSIFYFFSIETIDYPYLFKYVFYDEQKTPIIKNDFLKEFIFQYLDHDDYTLDQNLHFILYIYKDEKIVIEECKKIFLEYVNQFLKEYSYHWFTKYIFFKKFLVDYFDKDFQEQLDTVYKKRVNQLTIPTFVKLVREYIYSEHYKQHTLKYIKNYINDKVLFIEELKTLLVNHIKKENIYYDPICLDKEYALTNVFSDIPNVYVTKRVLREYEAARNLNQQYYKRYPFSTMMYVNVFPLETKINDQLLTFPVLKNVVDQFTHFYKNFYDRRKLTFNLFDGYALLTTKIKGKEYTFQVTTLQMILLLLFNKNNKYTYVDLKKHILLPKSFYSVLSRDLLSLCKSSLPLLIKVPNVKTLKDSDIFYLNKNFFYQKNIISCIPSKRTIPKIKEKKTLFTVSQSISIMSVIVRMMKKEKRLSYETLLHKLSLHKFPFVYTKKQVKDCIEKLISDLYLLRDKDNRNIYIYNS